MYSDDKYVSDGFGVARDKTGADFDTSTVVVSVTGGLIPSSISNVSVCKPLLNLEW